MKIGKLTHVGIANESSVPVERPCTYITATDVAKEIAQRTTTKRKYTPACQSTNVRSHNGNSEVGIL